MRATKQNKIFIRANIVRKGYEVIFPREGKSRSPRMKCARRESRYTEKVNLVKLEKEAKKFLLAGQRTSCVFYSSIEHDTMIPRERRG